MQAARLLLPIIKNDNAGMLHILHDPDCTMLCPAMTNHIGDSFADGAGEYCFNGGRYCHALHLAITDDTGGSQNLLRRAQFCQKSWLAITRDGFPCLAQRFTRHTFDIVYLLNSPFRCDHYQPTSQLTLQRNEGELMPQQVMQIARDAQPLL